MKDRLDPQIVLIAHNLRSCHNVGALFRTAEGLGVNKLYLTGYTPYPLAENDSRLPHLSQKITKQIAKTSLGAENSMAWEQSDDVTKVIEQLKHAGYQVVALEQAPNSVDLREFQASSKIALLVGREVEGVENEVIGMCNTVLEIPMLGKKESFNVVHASAMALFYLRHISS